MALWLAACGGSGGTDAGASDASSPRTDAGVADAGDAGAIDAGVIDAGAIDAARDAASDAGDASTTDVYSRAPGIWPITASTDPGCIQDAFGHRILSGSDDFHPGIDTCDDDRDDIDGTTTGVEVGLEVHAIADGVVTRVRLWDPAWDAAPSLCPSFCRQGNFLLIRHPELEPAFAGEVVQSIYMHMAQDTVSVAVGDPVAAGAILGRVGRTGDGINTVHLHFGLLVGSRETLIDADDYVNPLRVLPYPRSAPPDVSLTREMTASAFDAGECSAAETGGAMYPTLALRLEEPTPAFDTLRIEVASVGGGESHVLDIDARIGVGIDGQADDFEQGCVAVEAEDYREGSISRVLVVRFGGSFDTERYRVRLTDARGVVTELERAAL